MRVTTTSVSAFGITVFSVLHLSDLDHRTTFLGCHLWDEMRVGQTGMVKMLGVAEDRQAALELWCSLWVPGFQVGFQPMGAYCDYGQSLSAPFESTLMAYRDHKLMEQRLFLKQR